MFIRQVFWFEFIDFQPDFLILEIKHSINIQIREVIKNSSQVSNVNNGKF